LTTTPNFKGFLLIVSEYFRYEYFREHYYDIFRETKNQTGVLSWDYYPSAASFAFT